MSESSKKSALEVIGTTTSARRWGATMIYAINYDLKRPGQNYQELYAAIKDCGDWWHYLGSTWLIDTSLTSAALWTRLAPHVDQNDLVLVIGVSRDFTGWLPQEAWDWINSRTFKMAA